MQAKLGALARRLPGGLLLPLVLALVACETSPTEQLSRAEIMLNRLESKGADQYLIYELAEIRRGIETARKDMRNNRIAAAGRSLYAICASLDSCSTAFVNLRNQAATESRQQLQAMAQKLETLEQAITQLPRQTYVDQNRYDIQVHRLRRYHQAVADIEDLIQEQDFQKALDAGDNLAQQVKFMFAGLQPRPALARVGRRTTKQPPLSPPAETSTASAGMLAATAAH